MPQAGTPPRENFTPNTPMGTLRHTGLAQGREEALSPVTRQLLEPQRVLSLLASFHHLSALHTPISSVLLMNKHSQQLRFAPQPQEAHCQLCSWGSGGLKSSLWLKSLIL